MLVWSVAVTEMVAMVNVLIEGLRNPKRHRFHNAEEPVEDPRLEERIMNKVVRNPVDVP